MQLTSVPYLESAALASCRIFSRYICAARLLYFALVSLVVQPCWRKKAVWTRRGFPENEEKTSQRFINTMKMTAMLQVPSWGFSGRTYRIGVPSDLHTSQLKPVPVRVQLCGSENRNKSFSKSPHRHWYSIFQHQNETKPATLVICWTPQKN